MNQLVESVARTPHMIATEINTIKGQAMQVFLYSSAEIGRRLVEAKSLLAHGEWGDWLKNNVDYSQSTANNLMQIFREYGSDESKIAMLGNLSYTKALALLGIPEEEREQFIQENDIEIMSARELQQAIKEKQEAEKRAKAAEKAAEQERQAREKLVDEQKRQTNTYDAEIQRLQNELEVAQAGSDDEVVGKLQEALDLANSEYKRSNDRIAELEAALKEKPIDVPAVVEKIPEEIEAELAELRKKVAQPTNEAAIKFKLHLDTLVSDFRLLLGDLEEFKLMDPDSHVKYKVAVADLIRKMSDRL